MQPQQQPIQQHYQQQPHQRNSLPVSQVQTVRTINKDGYIHLVLDGEKHVNIMDYLKTEILDENVLKRIDRKDLIYIINRPFWYCLY